MRSQNATSLQDALRNVPGISYAAAEGGTSAIRCCTCASAQPGHLHRSVRDLGEYNIATFGLDDQFTDKVSLRNTLRFAKRVSASRHALLVVKRV